MLKTKQQMQGTKFSSQFKLKGLCPICNKTYSSKNILYKCQLSHKSFKLQLNKYQRTETRQVY